MDISVPPHFMCGDCPYDKVGYKCDIGKYLIFILELLKEKKKLSIQKYIDKKKPWQNSSVSITANTT